MFGPPSGGQADLHADHLVGIWERLKLWAAAGLKLLSSSEGSCRPFIRHNLRDRKSRIIVSEAELFAERCVVAYTKVVCASV